jgi:hypothetical protein
MSQAHGGSAVFVKFRGKQIYAEMGRLFYTALEIFSAAGYRVELFDNLPRAELGKYGPLALDLPALNITTDIPGDSREMIYLYDERDSDVGRRCWRKEVQIRDDVFAPYWLSEPVFMPYPVHPAHGGTGLPDRLSKFRDCPKSMRIFFSGDVDGYIRNRIRYPTEKLPRLTIINAIRERFAEWLTVVKSEAELATDLAAGRCRDRFVLAEPESFRIDISRWLPTIASADFFLCPPGYVMPMCHNTVEAMAVGTIPIINYPEWFQPGLVHLENCVAFGDADDLIRQLHAVIAMEPRRIAEMRQNVVKYYESSLTAESFARRIEASRHHKVVALMITDANTARNAARLNRHSVLLRDSTSGSGGARASVLHWLRSMNALDWR